MKQIIEFIKIEKDDEDFATFRITPNISNNGVYSNGSYKVRVSLSCMGFEIRERDGLTKEELEKIVDYLKPDLFPPRDNINK